MSIIEKLNKAIDERDGDTASELIHDDFQFYFHSSGKTIGKKEVIEWMKSGDVTNEKVRILFENDEVGFDHCIVRFADGNREAVMAHYKFKDGSRQAVLVVYIIKDGKIIRSETGATKLAK